MAERKPYLRGSDDFLYAAPPIARGDIYNVMRNAGRMGGAQMRAPNDFNVYPAHGMQTTASFYYNDTRDFSIFDGISRLMD